MDDLIDELVCRTRERRCFEEDALNSVSILVVFHF